MNIKIYIFVGNPGFSIFGPYPNFLKHKITKDSASHHGFLYCSVPAGSPAGGAKHSPILNPHNKYEV